MADAIEEEANVNFEPVVKLETLTDLKTNEEDENVLFKMRAKLFRFDRTNSEWKERGTGDLKILEHKETKKQRIVMRRDKTLKICANHYITPEMSLSPNIGSDRSWVYNTSADMSPDNEGNVVPTAETLAVRFSNSDNAKTFQTAFEAAQQANGALLGGSGSVSSAPASTEEKKEEAPPAEEKKEEAPAAKTESEADTPKEETKAE
ncbi:hypothetical protein BT69DRAFT_1381896 [Atractiella rhizophila]|nr:hypothetical protein BT69DRAFT_1381896 [Atractiella rhizophila]